VLCECAVFVHLNAMGCPVRHSGEAVVVWLLLAGHHRVQGVHFTWQPLCLPAVASGVREVWLPYATGRSDDHAHATTSPPVSCNSVCHVAWQQAAVPAWLPVMGMSARPLAMVL
jgi:hypothetical protein